MEKIPHDLGAERAVLCASMASLNAAMRSYELLSIEDFYDNRHKIIFNSISDIVQSGATPDIVLICSYLETNQWLDEAGGYSYIASITDSLPDTSNIDHYCRLVKEASVKRAYMSLGHNILAGMNMNLSELTDMVSKNVLAIGGATHNGAISAKDAASKELERIHRLRTEGRTELKPTGISGLDSLLGGGLENGQLFVIAALTSVGKTALALQIATNMAKNGQRVIYHSLEMSEAQLVRRVLCSQTGIKAGRMKYGMINDDGGVNALSAATASMSVLPLYFDDRSTVSLNDIRASARRMQLSTGGLGAIFVDYLQLVRPPKAENRVQQVSAISRGLKVIAKELNVPVIALSQLNRAPERRMIESQATNNKAIFRHNLSELRESGSIEQDSDIVAFIIRATRQTLPWDDSNIRPTILQVAKHRDGPLADICLEFDPDYSVFKYNEHKIKEEAHGKTQWEGREINGGAGEPS